MSPGTPAEGLRIVGVTGGVGSGKSTAARLLAEALDALLLDADQIVQELLVLPQTLVEIELAVGFQVSDEHGALDRGRLAEKVFADPQARRALEGVLHPAVRRRMREALATLERERPGQASAVLDVPLLREGGLDVACDAVIHVEAPEEARCQRARARHGWTEEAWRAREAAQMPVAEKAERADAILVNDAEPEALPERIAALLPQLRGLPPRPLCARWPTEEAGTKRRDLS